MCIEPYGAADLNEDAVDNPSDDFTIFVGGIPGYVSSDPANPFNITDD